MYNFYEMKEQDDRLQKELIVLKKEYQKPQMTKEQLEELCIKIKETDMEKNKRRTKAKVIGFMVGAAAMVAAVIILPNTSAAIAHAMGQIPFVGSLTEAVTFRDYEYEEGRNKADIKVPEIEINEQIPASGLQETLEHTTDEINTEIRKITDELIGNFELALQEEEGYQNIVVKGEVLATTKDYFTLKLMCYRDSGTGYQWNYYYTIDLITGERLKLKDIFTEGADYITPISQNIKEQMQAQMEEDEKVYYWLNDEIEEWNFKSITEEPLFYLNENDNIVIGFNEGEVAPMYMGAVEFEIPSEVLGGIRK